MNKSVPPIPGQAWSHEPWREYGSQFIDSASDANDGFICHQPGNGEKLPENNKSMRKWPANKARIIACVNACAGIPNPEHLPTLVKAAKWLLSPKPAQTDELRKFNEGLGKLLKDLGVVE